MRKQFEQWRRKECGNPDLIFERKSHNQDAYLNCITQSRWVTYKEAWQASRAALVVDLPKYKKLSQNAPQQAMQVRAIVESTISECSDCIRAAGISVKEK